MILWRSPLFQLLFLATHSTKESSFDWFKLHSPLLKSQEPDRQVIMRTLEYRCVLQSWYNVTSNAIWKSHHATMIVDFILQQGRIYWSTMAKSSSLSYFEDSSNWYFSLPLRSLSRKIVNDIQVFHINEKILFARRFWRLSFTDMFSVVSPKNKYIISQCYIYIYICPSLFV